VREATGAWMLHHGHFLRASQRRSQAARNLLDAEDGFLLGNTHLIMDRDPVFSKDVRDFLRGAGVDPVRLPARNPNLNAFAERFVLSILLGEGHLRLAVREYVAHYNHERPHQGLDGTVVVPPANENRSGAIECRERLGGLLRFYRRQAA
jgi:putative transposase